MTTSDKVKVVLDSDVIIHFIKGDSFSLLPKILPTYSFIILDIVFANELAKSHRVIIQNTITLLKTISFEKWEPQKEERLEFINLQKKYGLGESAAMAAMDFLYQAMINKIMTEQECDIFITKVISKNSILPVKKMSEFNPRINL